MRSENGKERPFTVTADEAGAHTWSDRRTGKLTRRTGQISRRVGFLKIGWPIGGERRRDAASPWHGRRLYDWGGHGRDGRRTTDPMFHNGGPERQAFGEDFGATMSERGAGRIDTLIQGMETIAKGIAYLSLIAVLSAVAGGILWGVGYRIAKAIGGW